MVFNRDKSFFLTLDEDAPAATLAMPEAPSQQKDEAAEVIEEPVTLSVAATEESSSPAPAAVRASEASTNASEQPSVQTAAEAIAAKLAASEAARPAVTFSTFAPENLAAGAGLPSRRRRPGAAMNGFRSLAADLFKS